MKSKTSFGNIIDLVFKGVAVAMAVAAVALNILKAADVNVQVLLLGIGVFCLAVTALGRNDEDE